jgi:hypothetical protein
MPADPEPSLPRWLLPSVLTVAVLAMGIGGALALRGMGSALPPPPPATANAPQQTGDTGELEEPVGAGRGKKSPKAFGLPVYPTSFDFQSMEVNPKTASSSFLVKSGSAADVVRYYIEKLGEMGWEYQWKREATTRPGDVGQTLTLKGTRVRWMHRRERRQLTLLALDDTQKGRTAQGVLSWAPLPKSPK